MIFGRIKEGRLQEMSLEQQAAAMLPSIERELQRQIRRVDGRGMKPFHEMLAYHMGWTQTRAGKPAGAKRIRPLLMLLVCEAVGGDWRDALPGAAALEIVHNFSLVHDDIQDNSPTRRGRPALWTLQGTALAINAGDALLTIANQALLDLERSRPASQVLLVTRVLQDACLDLTRGQYLDLCHQERNQLSLRAYWSMIDGKTAALLAACTEIGAILGGANKSTQGHYREFGRVLGAAFQVQDDILGVWGDESATGKSAASDLAEGKLSLPVVYGLRKRGQFARSWLRPRSRPRRATALRQMLSEEGAYDYSVRQSQRLTRQALLKLQSLRPRGAAGAALAELTQQLLNRQK
jgi:geranylgeranyl diphosphate synthase type I